MDEVDVTPSEAIIAAETSGVDSRHIRCVCALLLLITFFWELYIRLSSEEGVLQVLIDISCVFCTNESYNNES